VWKINGVVGVVQERPWLVNAAERPLKLVSIPNATADRRFIDEFKLLKTGDRKQPVANWPHNESRSGYDVLCAQGAGRLMLASRPTASMGISKGR